MDITMVSQAPVNLQVIDERITDVDDWIVRAGDALGSFYSVGEGGFRRSTMSEAEATSATSTYRALFALVELRRVLIERGGKGKTLDGKLEITAETIEEQIRGVASSWLLPLRTNQGLESVRGQSENDKNDFTDAHLLTAAALAPGLASLCSEAKLGNALGRIRGCTGRLASDLCERLESSAGGTIEPGGGAAGVHDFVTLHAVRGIDAYKEAFRESSPSLPANLRDRVQERVLRQLAYRSADVLAQFDPAELLFAAALLGRLKTADWQQVTQRAVWVVTEVQSEDGAWPSSRIVAYEAKRLLHVASYELALTLANIVYRDLTERHQPVEPTVLESLERAMRLVRAGYVSGENYRGWANDRTRWQGLIESWATAIVLTFLVRYREVLLTARQLEVLRRYRADSRQAARPIWPELDWVLRIPGSSPYITPLSPDQYSDPSGGELAAALQKYILAPVADSPVERPGESGAALILYGKPGTRKTSLVKGLAKCLQWPMITLSPPNFLGDGGLEGFEAAADKIFRDLMRLRRCVVLFDECEDFFKPRPKSRRGDQQNATPEQRPESRTIGAFLTAGMLPRLQTMRDERWVILVLATNSGLEDLDEAVIRPGRFDFAQELSHPVLAAQCDYVDVHRQPLTDPQRDLLKDALRAVAETSQEDMPFAVIDDLARDVARSRVKAQPKILERELRKRQGRKGPPPLYG